MIAIGFFDKKTDDHRYVALSFIVSTSDSR